MVAILEKADSMINDLDTHLLTPLARARSTRRELLIPPLLAALPIALTRTGALAAMQQQEKESSKRAKEMRSVAAYEFIQQKYSVT